MTPEEQHIEREVQRQLSSQTQRLNQELEYERQKISRMRDDLIRQHNVIKQLTGTPMRFGTLIRSHNFVDPVAFQRNVEIIVVDRDSPHYNKGGIVVGEVNDNGYVPVKLSDDHEVEFAIGQEGKDAAQIRLTQDDDGTYALVVVDGKPWEVQGVPDDEMKPGDTIKLKGDNHQIVGLGYEDIAAGPVCRVSSVLDDGVEIYAKQDTRFVQNPRGFELEEGDRVVVDD